MKKTHFIQLMNSMKANLSKNTVTPEAQALIDEINTIINNLQNEPDVEYNEADVMAKVTEVATKAGATAAAQMENTLRKEFAKNKVADKDQARKIYEQALANSAGKGKGEIGRQLKALMVENGITGLPSITEVFPEIQTLFEQHSIMSKLRKLGRQALTFGISSQSDDSEDVRAQGHQVGEAKRNQTLTLTPKTINLGAIYKKIDIPKITSYQTGNPSELFRWLAQELIERIDAEITRAIIVGDGRANDSKFKVSSFETIGTKTAGDSYTVYANKSNALPTLADLRAVVDQMDDSKPISMYIHPTLKTALQKHVYATGGTELFLTDQVLIEQLGISEIIKYKKLAAAVPGTVSKVPAVVFIQHDNYGYVGSEIFTADYEDWTYNTDNMIAECFAGGAIIKPLSTGLITISKTA